MTVSYAKAQKENTDTIKCYGVTELREIASCFIELDACDTLYTNCKTMLANRDAVILEKDAQLSSQSGIILMKDKIIGIKEDDISKLTDALNKANNHKKLLAIGWGSTSAILTGFLIYFAVR